MESSVMKAFNQGGMVRICCTNKSTVPFHDWKAGKDFLDFVGALADYAAEVANVWGQSCELYVADKPQPGVWHMLFTDTTDELNAFGYHDTTPDGFPLLHMFVKTSLRAGDLVSTTASHELAEALIDPCTNLCAVGPYERLYAYEVCDAVEDEHFPIWGIEMSNYVYPAWFESFQRPAYDHMGTCKHSFEIRPGGYMPIFADGEWTQIFGSDAKRKDFKETPRYRARLLGREVRAPTLDVEPD